MSSGLKRTRTREDLAFSNMTMPDHILHQLQHHGCVEEGSGEIRTGVIHLVLSVPRRYYLIQQAMTWQSAQVYCRANHDDLAVINSDDDLIRFQSEVQKQQFSSKAWVGMYNDVNSWRWSLGNEPIGTTLWAAIWKQPNNGPEICGTIKQKLKDHGMADNIRVWWKERADGLVFHKEK
ncbi:hypothetical protein QTP86_002991 [Hemibagrus guttatus]|nr:hypothetical protein QTP86_002991 [Hemibagrus guttatus]